LSGSSPLKLCLKREREINGVEAERERVEKLGRRKETKSLNFIPNFHTKSVAMSKPKAGTVSSDGESKETAPKKESRSKQQRVRWYGVKGIVGPTSKR